MIEIGIGDLVKGRDGIQRVVEALRLEDRKVECVWFDRDGTLHRQAFALEDVILERRAHAVES